MSQDEKSSKATRFTIVAVVAVVAVLVAVVGALALFPSSEQSLSEGTTPSSTTVAPNASDTTTSTPPASSSSTTAEPEAQVAIDPNTAPARLIDVDLDFQVITSWNGQLLARVGLRDSPLELFLSPDGIEWAELDTPVLALTAEERSAIDWWSFFPPNQGLVIQGFNSDTRTDVVLTSEDAVNWDRIDLADRLEPAATPTSILDDGVLVLQGGADVTSSLLSQHTNIKPPPSGICAVFETDISFTVAPCGDEERSTLTASNVISSVDPEQFVRCLSFVSEEFVLNSQTLQLITSEQDSATAAPVSFPTGIFSLASLQDTRLAVLSGSIPDPSACDGVIELPPATDSSITVFDQNLEIEISVPLPSELSGRFIQIVGEIDLPASNASVILVQTASEIWGLDTVSRQWQVLADFQAGGGPAGDPVVSGNVVYHNQARGLSVLEVSWDETTSTVEATERVLPYVTEDGSSGPVSVGTVPFQMIAFPGSLIVLDRAGRLWTVGVPN